MKFKNIVASFTCYFILTAFVGCITCGALFHSEIQQQKVLHFSNKKANDINPSFLFEEDEDSDDSIKTDAFHHEHYLKNSLNSFYLKATYTAFSKLQNQDRKSKIPLFIHFKTLRI